MFVCILLFMGKGGYNTRVTYTHIFKLVLSVPNHGEGHHGHHGHHVLVRMGSKPLYTVHIIIRYLWNGVSLSQEAESIFDFSDYLLLFNLLLDLDLRLKVMAPL